MKKFLGILVLGLLWCNYVFSAESVTKKDNVSLLAVILGDSVENYTKSGSCWESSVAVNWEYDHMICLIKSESKNKTFNTRTISVRYFPISKKIYQIQADSLDTFISKEHCRSQVVPLAELIAAQKEKFGFNKYVEKRWESARGWKKRGYTILVENKDNKRIIITARCWKDIELKIRTTIILKTMFSNKNDKEFKEYRKSKIDKTDL
jgi:hypothetical protein